MAFEVKMPQLGLTMEEGTVTKWVKQEGDTVKAGDVILEITTDKLTSEVESEHDGVLLKIVAQEGEDIPVKGLLAYIGEAGEQVGDAPAAKAEAPAAEAAAPVPAAAPAAPVTVISALFVQFVMLPSFKLPTIPPKVLIMPLALSLPETVMFSNVVP